MAHLGYVGSDGKLFWLTPSALLAAHGKSPTSACSMATTRSNLHDRQQGTAAQRATAVSPPGLGAISITMPINQESSEDAIQRVLPVLQEAARSLRPLM